MVYESFFLIAIVFESLTQELNKAKANKLEDNNKDKFKFGRDYSFFKCYNYDKIGYMS